MASAMSRVGTPTSATACRRAPAGAFATPEGNEARGIGPVHGGPPVGPVSRVTGDALLAGYGGDRRDEPVVASSVHGWREPQAHGVHAAVDELEREVLAAATGRLGAMERGRVVLCGRPALGEGGDARGEQEGVVGAGERLADGLDRGSLGRARGGRVGPVMLVREMDDCFGGLRASTDARKIVEVTAADANPLACRAAAEAPDLASPVTSCPAARSSSTVAEPIDPEAPVTKTRMALSLRLRHGRSG